MKKSIVKISFTMIKILVATLVISSLANHAIGDPTVGLDTRIPLPKYFTVGTLMAGSTGSLEDSWTLTLTRTGATTGYGAYTVTYTEEGYDPDNSTIENFPNINPMHVDSDEGGGQGGGTPPGQGGTPPGQGGTPPGQGGTPPGQGGTPPGQGGGRGH
ncbi:MAG: hypothetical protein JW806_02350 [Sedimentisphaerales bacterium]|nr:hypothetical protein [Sedimentisphaerales bacterium]